PAGFAIVLEGWSADPRFRAPWLHNAVHVWVGGDMSPSTSPNDPRRRSFRPHVAPAMPSPFFCELNMRQAFWWPRISRVFRAFSHPTCASCNSFYGVLGVPWSYLTRGPAAMKRNRAYTRQLTGLLSKPGPILCVQQKSFSPSHDTPWLRARSVPGAER